METAIELYVRLASDTAPWQASDRKKFVAAAKALADGDAGPQLLTKEQLRQAAEVYFTMAAQDFDPKWVGYVKTKFAAAVVHASDAEDKGARAMPATKVLSACDDPYRVGSFDSALLRIRKQPQWLVSRRARIRAVQQELDDAKKWTPEQGVILEPALQ